MNKHQEAYEKLLNAVRTNYGTHSEFYKTAKELVDKATPKKVIRKPVKYYVDFCCPSCERKLSSRVKYHFCPKKDCGQAIDWSDDS